MNETENLLFDTLTKSLFSFFSHTLHILFWKQGVNVIRPLTSATLFLNSQAVLFQTENWLVSKEADHLGETENASSDSQVAKGHQLVPTFFHSSSHTLEHKY